MRAKIEVEVDGELTDVEARALIVEELFNLCYGWVQGDLIPRIDFSYDEDEERVDYSEIKWSDNNNGLVN